MVLRPRNGLSLCAGGGGLDMGLMLAEPGFHTRCFVEWEDYPRRAIIAAQRAGYFAPAPIWDDVTTFDGRPFRGAIDTLLAGYPCQPFSMAGQRKGADDERHLWPDVARVADELGPGLRWVFLENVAGHLSLGLETVLRDLWGLGFTPAAGLFSAGETGASHERQRVFIVAYRSQARCKRAFGQDANFQLGEGGAPLVHPERAERRAETATGHLRDGDNPGRNQASGRPGEPSSPLGHASRIGCGEGRAEPAIRGGRDTSASAGRAMADASSGTGHEGSASERRGRYGAGGAWKATGIGRSRAALFPPGPSDMGGWADVLASAPYLAPATSLADCLAWARDMAAALEVSGQEAAQPALRRMADGLALRSRALRLLGNGVHPLAAGYAWRSLAVAHGLSPVDLDAEGRGEGTGTDGLVVTA